MTCRLFLPILCFNPTEKKVIKNNIFRLIPFGAGRRVCIGEVLAKNRMFLMMSGIVQNFTFKPKSEAEKPDHDPRNYLPGLATHPKDFEVCAVPRRL